MSKKLPQPISKEDRNLFIYSLTVRSLIVSRYLMCGLLVFAIISLPVVYILDYNHALPCSWVEGTFGANTTYYQEYDKRCAETWRSNG